MKKDLHEDFIRECNILVKESQESGDLPFGSVLVKDDEIVSRGINTAQKDITGHAEINAIKNYLSKNSRDGLRECTLYSNFEPCAMCSFVIRDYGIKKVVFAVPSPHLGGETKWPILSDKIYEPFFSQGTHEGPEIIGNILRDESQKIFDELNWKMHLSEEEINQVDKITDNE